MLQPKRAAIGIEQNKPEAIAAISAVLGSGIELLPLHVRYPQGAEKVLIEKTTGREVPRGGLPADVGVIVMNVTSTAFVGDLANFVVGCSLVLPATIFYHAHKSKHSAIIGLAIGTLVMTVFGSAFNAVYLLPKFAQLYGIPLDTIIAMGTAIRGGVSNVSTFVLLCVAPLNLLKGAVVSVLTMLLYKRVARPLFGLHQ